MSTQAEQLHPSLVSKIRKMQEKYCDVMVFSKLLPMYAHRIINDELTGHDFCRLSSGYKNVRFSWGINWQTVKPLNYFAETFPHKGLVAIYINCIDLFGNDVGDFARNELGKITPEIKVHFYDYSNTTFYFLPDELAEGLEKISSWYEETKVKIKPHLTQLRREKLERELAELGVV